MRSLKTGWPDAGSTAGRFLERFPNMLQLSPNRFPLVSHPTGPRCTARDLSGMRAAQVFDSLRHGTIGSGSASLLIRWFSVYFLYLLQHGRQPCFLFHPPWPSGGTPVAVGPSGGSATAVP